MAETNPTCPTHEQLLGYKRKSLAPGEADQITAHLKGCRNCQKSLVSLVVSGVHSSKSSEETLDPDTMIAPGGARTSAPDLEEESRRGKKSSRPKPPAEYPFLEPPEDSNEFARLGFYSIKRVLGSGGMGVVFEAVDQRLGRTVALKVLRPELADESYVERFRQEARLAASLSDEHIVTIFEVGLTNNVPFMAMEFLHGETLDARLNRDSWLSVEESLALLKQVAQGLVTAHGAGLIHRDIKPANLWLESHKDSKQFKRVKILDFGLAKEVAKESNLTAAGMVVGTPSYMAPEQVYGLPCDQRTDLFSLGCVLYRMLSGKAPFTGENTLAVLEATVDEGPAPDLKAAGRKAPKAVLAILERLLAKNPDDRPATAKALIETIDAVLRGGQALHQTVRVQNLTGKAAPGRKISWWVAGSGALAAITVLTSVLLFMFSGKPGTGEGKGEGDKQGKEGIATAAGGKPIKVGVLFSQTGRLAPTEQPIRRAVLKALGDSASEGKTASPVAGHPVTIVMADGGSDPAQFAREARRLASEGCEVIFGCWSSSARREVVEALAKHEGGNHDCVLFHPVHSEGMEDSSHAVYLGALPDQQTERVLEYSRKELTRGKPKARVFILGGDTVYPRATAEVVRMMVETRFAADFEVGGMAFVPTKVPFQIERDAIPAIAASRPDIIISLLSGLDMNERFINGMRHNSAKAAPIPIFSFSLSESDLQNMSDQDILPVEFMACSYFGSIAANRENAALKEQFRSGNAPLIVSEAMEKAYNGVKMWQGVRAGLGDKPSASDLRKALLEVPVPSVLGTSDRLVRPESAPLSLYASQRIHIGRIIEGREISLVTNVARAPVFQPDPYPGPTPLSKRSPAEAAKARKGWTSYLEGLRKAFGGSWENTGVEPVRFDPAPWWKDAP